MRTLTVDKTSYTVKRVSIRGRYRTLVWQPGRRGLVANIEWKRNRQLNLLTTRKVLREKKEVPVKAYAILEKDTVAPETPRETIQGETVLLTKKDLDDWENTKQRIITDFTDNLWAKGDKGSPSGRPEWSDKVEVRT